MLKEQQVENLYHWADRGVGRIERLHALQLQPTEREDLLQDVIVRTITNPNITDAEHAARYAYVTAEGIVRNYLRDQKVQRMTSLDSPIDTERQLALKDTIPSAGGIEDKQQSLFINERLEKLPERTQHVAGLIRQGYTQEEVATILSTSQPTVYRELRKLREELHNELFEG